MVKAENIILIGSSGKNCGKTEYACKLIQRLSGHYEVIGAKITSIRENGEKCPRGNMGCGVCGSLSEPYLLTVETDRQASKDTSRMLRSGARKVYWLRVMEKHLPEGISELLRAIPDKALLVCESNSMGSVVDPGLFLLIRNISDPFIKQSYQQVRHLADRIVLFDGKDWDISPERIQYFHGQWTVREKATAVILAGGRSQRMGEDKSLMPCRGKPLIREISDQLLPHFDEVIIGANDIGKYRFLNLRIIRDLEPGKGPLMGILSCLKSSRSDINFVTACDIPVMNIPLIRSMLARAADCDIVMPLTGDHGYEPLYAVYRKGVIKPAEDILRENKRRIIELLAKVHAGFVDMNINGWYHNLNTKQNYADFILRQG